MTLEVGDIIFLTHEGNDKKSRNHPFLVINVFNNQAVVLQASSIKYNRRGEEGFRDNDIYEEDCAGDTIEVNQEDGFKQKSVILINYHRLIDNDVVYSRMGQFRDLEKLKMIIDKYLTKPNNLIQRWK